MKNLYNYPSVKVPNHCAISKIYSMGDTEILVRGRLLLCESTRICLSDDTGKMFFYWDTYFPHNLKLGDILELCVYPNRNGRYEVKSHRILVTSRRAYNSGDWNKFHEDGNSFELLKQRSQILANIRTFFKNLEYTEVETPYLNKVRGFDTNIEQFKTSFNSLSENTEYYLATSPELFMKRLLSMGFDRIFQMGRCFRNGEYSRLHRPEFTMVEWYRLYSDFSLIMKEAEALVRMVFINARTGGTLPESLNVVLDCDCWPKITVVEAFKRWACIDLKACLTDDKLYQRLQEINFFSANKSDDWEDLFNKVLMEIIEPELKKLGAVFLVEYPLQMAAMARPCDNDSRFVERAELYINGIELANGYTELNDPVEQRERFVSARLAQERDDKLDEKFLEQLEVGMPPATGIALGVDRLVMLATGSTDLKEVISFEC